MSNRKDIVEAIKAEFPKHNKAAYSMATRTAETGVELCKRAKEIEDLICRQISPKKDNHRLRYSLRVRVTKDRYERVKQLIEQDGRFPTVQAWLDWWVFVWVRGKEGKNAD